MLIQFHHQPKSYLESHKTEMMVQGEVFSHAEVEDMLKIAQKEKPLPDGMHWLCVNEKSSLFWKTTE